MAIEIPRVTPEQIDEQVVAVQYYQFPGTFVTVACITMRNGFNTIGSSACAHPDLFNKDIGEQLALKDAKQKIWPLLGYMLKDSLRL